MNLDDFLKAAAGGGEPPAGLDQPLLALWHAGRGDWDRAHQIAQAIRTRDGNWIHANLHREEGDLWNARYWYDRAGRPESRESVAAERREIIAALLRS